MIHCAVCLKLIQHCKSTIFHIKKEWKRRLKKKVLEICFTTVWIYNLPLNNAGLNRESSLICGFFFNKYNTCIFILQVFNSVWGKVCVRLEIIICRIKRTAGWVLILSKRFQLPGLGWVIYQFLCFWGRDRSL